MGNFIQSYTHRSTYSDNQPPLVAESTKQSKEPVGNCPQAIFELVLLVAVGGASVRQCVPLAQLFEDARGPDEAFGAPSLKNA